LEVVPAELNVTGGDTVLVLGSNDTGSFNVCENGGGGFTSEIGNMTLDLRNVFGTGNISQIDTPGFIAESMPFSHGRIDVYYTLGPCGVCEGPSCGK